MITALFGVSQHTKTENKPTPTELKKEVNSTDFKVIKIKKPERKFFAPPIDMTNTYTVHLLTDRKDDDAWISITAHRSFIDQDKILEKIKKIDSRVQDVGKQELLADKHTMQAIVVVPKEYAAEIMEKLKSNKNIISAEEKKVIKCYFV